MALTRKMLKAMGIEDEKIDQIIEAHTEATDALKKQRDDATERAEANAEKAKELDEIKANPGEDYKAKYEAEKEAFEQYKANVAGKQKAEETKRLFLAQLEELGITGKRAEAIAKATDYSAFEVEDGAFSDEKAVKEAIKADWGDFIPKNNTVGADVPKPPENSGGTAKTREEIVAIKDASERQQAWADYLSAQNESE